MSIRYGLLALLADGPRYGNQLRSEFEHRTAATWPLNVGQVYTTMSRLERDGLVEPAGDDGDGHALYRLTEAGRADLDAWWRTPVRREGRPRDELAIKLALAVTVPGVDVRALVQLQRNDTIRSLQEYTRLKANQPEPDLAWQLVLDALVFQGEAEIRWLDHCEARLARDAGLAREQLGRREVGATSPSDAAAAVAVNAEGAPR
jgi:DNA-binding PadR family transcriptional regulator